MSSGQQPEQMSEFDGTMGALVGVTPAKLGDAAAKSQAKAVIREIVRIAGGRLLGKTRLYKIFYFAHLFYAKSQTDSLTDWPIVRMPHGPGIEDGDALLAELTDDHAIEVRNVAVGPYPSIEFRCSQSEIPKSLSLDGIDAIRNAVTFAAGKSAAELSELTHEYSHSWRDASDGEEIDVYVDLLTASEYHERKASMESTYKALRAVW